MNVNQVSGNVDNTSDETTPPDIAVKEEAPPEVIIKEEEDEDEEEEEEEEETFESASKSVLPEKSATKYYATYDRFMKWIKAKKIKTISENVLLTYFSDIAKAMKPSTLWSHYSMLKPTLNSKQNIRIEKYGKLTAFLKRQSSGFKSKKSKILSSNNIEKFLNEAPDHQYLATKVALIIGITGACRRDELYNITVKDVQHFDSMFLITLPKTKNYLVRSFTIIGEFYSIVKKYWALRPKVVDSDHFFLNYQNGKCTKQVIGINKFGAMPKQIASYLHLPDPKAYTGHSFRRTSASLLADSGANFRTLKRHSGWKNTTVIEGDIHNESISNKKIVSNLITETIILNKSTSRENLRNEASSPNANHTQPNTSVRTYGKSSSFEGGQSSPPYRKEFPQVDEYATEGKSKTEPVAFVNVNANLYEEQPVDNVPPLVPTTMPTITSIQQVAQLPPRDKTSASQRSIRIPVQSFVKQVRNIAPANNPPGSVNQPGQQQPKTLVLKTIPLKVKQVAPTTIKMPPRQSAPGVPQSTIPQQSTEVCLRWNSYHSNMQNSFPSLLDAEQFVDVTLACEGRSLKCHKMILSTCSDYLAELLRENPCQHPIILMKDLKFWEVEALVKFMYRGEVNVAHEKLPQLLNAAEALQVKGLAGPSQNSKPPLLIPQGQVKQAAAPSVPTRVASETKENKPSTSSGPATLPSSPKRAQKRRTSEAAESRPFTKIRLQQPSSPVSPNTTVKLEPLDIPVSPTEMFSDSNLMSLHEEEDPGGSVRDSEDQDLTFGNMDGPPDLTDGEDQDQMEFVPTDFLEQEQDIVEDLEPDSSIGEREDSRKSYNSEDCEDDEMDEKEKETESEALEGTETSSTEKSKCPKKDKTL